MVALSATRPTNHNGRSDRLSGLPRAEVIPGTQKFQGFFKKYFKIITQMIHIT